MYTSLYNSGNETYPNMFQLDDSLSAQNWCCKTSNHKLQSLKEDA